MGLCFPFLWDIVGDSEEGCGSFVWEEKTFF